MAENPAMYYYVEDIESNRWFSHSGWLGNQVANKHQLQSLDMFFNGFSRDGENGVSWFEIRKWPSNDRIMCIDER
jgi:hypothetical protein